MTAKQVFMKKGEMNGWDIPNDMMAEIDKEKEERDKKFVSLLEKLKDFPNTKQYELLMEKIQEAIKQDKYGIYLDNADGKFDFEVIRTFFTNYGYLVQYGYCTTKEFEIRWDVHTWGREGSKFAKALLKIKQKGEYL